MDVRTSIGELAIHSGGRDYIFRPLFCRIERLGAPKEIIQLFNESQTQTNEGFIASYRILCAFSDDYSDDEIYALLGYFERDEKENCLKYIAGETPPEHIHILGANIIKLALVGKPNKFDKRKSSKGKPEDSFNPSEFVAIGDANFSGINWWNKTMIELYQAIKASGTSEEEKSFMDSEQIEDLYKRAKVTK